MGGGVGRVQACGVVERQEKLDVGKIEEAEHEEQTRDQASSNE